MMPGTPMRRTVLLWLPILVCLFLLAAAGTFIFRQNRTIRNQAEQLSQRSAENDQLRRQIHDLTANPPVGAGSTPAPPPRSATSSSSAVTPEELSTAQQSASRLRESLAQSNAEVTRLESQINDLRSRIDSATEENQRLSDSAESGKRSLAEANQELQSVRTELKATADRVTQLEGINATSKQDAATAKQAGAQLSQTVTDLQGVFHRRDMYLNDILVRYREVTEQYRAIAGVMDGRRERQASPVSPPEISRIQNAIALADEDLKQIHALDAQAQRLQKKLAGK